MCCRKEGFFKASNMFKRKDQIILSASRTDCEKTLMSVVLSPNFAYLCLFKSNIFALKSLELHGIKRLQNLHQIVSRAVCAAISSYHS